MKQKVNEKKAYMEKTILNVCGVVQKLYKQLKIQDNTNPKKVQLTSSKT